MTNSMADQNMGIGSQARAILALLSSQEPHFADYENGYYQIWIDTTAWYNGREKGIALTINRYMSQGPALIITFGEVRNSDSIFIDHWEMENRQFNMPVVADFTDEAYENREYIEYGNVGKASSRIMEIAAEYYERMRLEEQLRNSK